MSDNAFYKLAPFVQEYIYRHKWETMCKRYKTEPSTPSSTGQITS